MPHPILYEINTRCWLNDLSRESGRRVTLASIDDSHFAQWKRLGYTHIWLMGVWATGKQSRDQALNSAELRREFDQALPGWKPNDVGGSPYAIAAYQVPRSLGGESGLKRFRKKLASFGMKLILDFVPNHLALDHPWVQQHPERFVQCNTSDAGSFIGGSKEFPVRLCHGRDPYFDPWMDTVQLDYRRADTREAAIQQLWSIASRCDGVRCDMAMLLIQDIFPDTWREHPCRGKETSEEFWPKAISSIRAQHPQFLFLAEVYWEREPQLVSQGFDYAYHKPLTDAALAQRDHVQAVVLKSNDWINAAAHFLENHDEERVASLLTLDVHRAAAWGQLSLPGMRFIHEGQLEGWKTKTSVQLAVRAPEKTDPAVSGMYAKLLTAISDTGIGRVNGKILNATQAWKDNETHKWFLLSLWHSSDGTFWLAVTNFGPHRSQCYTSIDIEWLPAHQWTMADRFSNDRYLRDGEDIHLRGLYLDVPAYATQCFEFAPLK